MITVATTARSKAKIGANATGNRLEGIGRLGQTSLSRSRSTQSLNTCVLAVASMTATIPIARLNGEGNDPIDKNAPIPTIGTAITNRNGRVISIELSRNDSFLHRSVAEEAGNAPCPIIALLIAPMTLFVSMLLSLPIFFSP